MSPLSVSRNLTWNAIYFITMNPFSLSWNSKLKNEQQNENFEISVMTDLKLALCHAESELPLNQQPNMKAHV